MPKTGIPDARLLNAKQNLSPAIKAYTATANTLVLSDNNKIITVSNAAANTVTVPQNSSVAFPIGTSLPIIQIGAGQTSIVAGSGTTLQAPNGLKLRTQYSTVFIMKIATNTWVVGGDTAV